ncbi:MAG TPA: hypothetical protein VL972_09875 [Solirubrobacteraceae bacterium]|nr:hypothetical protein [Solirubrobacteraceae bacterium]
MLVPMAALGAAFGVAPTSASAKLPEWGKCIATASGAGGRYMNAGCTERARKVHDSYPGAYEWQPATEEFSTKQPGGVKLQGPFSFETSRGIKIECGRVDEFSSMYFVANGATTPLWYLDPCRANGDEWCVTLEIGGFADSVNDDLERIDQEERGWDHPSQLGFVERGTGSEPIIGLGFKESYETARKVAEPFFTQISCSPEVTEGTDEEPKSLIGDMLIGGDRTGGNGVIGTLGPVDAMSSTYTLTYSESSPGIQSPTRFALKKRQVLEAFVQNQWEPVAFVGQMDLAFAEAWEIKATR